VSIHKDFPRPWHITHTTRHRAHGYYSHIRAANDNYVVERITDEDLALYIVQVVNERDQLRADLAAANARAEVAEAELAAWRRRSTKAERHVELLKKELDSVPVAALSILADAVDDTPDDVTQWLAWAELGAHWQPADQPCPDCEANALAVAVHADGEIEQWLCEECGYVAAEIKDRSAT
jgi:ribosomal protein S27AE